MATCTFKGSARVWLDCLTFEESFGRQMDDSQNILQLKQILTILRLSLAEP